MAKSVWRIQLYFSTGLLHLLLQQVLVQSSDTNPSTLPVWTPLNKSITPVLPVEYEFGGKKICLVLSSSTTAVVSQPNVTNTSHLFMVDLQQSDLEIFQTADSCPQCQSLIINTNTTNLTEAEFSAFYNGMETRISYGPLGFFNPAGGNVLYLSRSDTVTLLYRTVRREEFEVCSNGSRANFHVLSEPSEQCAQGSGAQGFSVPSEVTIVYAGSIPASIIGQDFLITSQSCEDPYSGDTFSFTVSAPITIPTPTTTPIPTLPVSATISVKTPSPTSSSNTVAPPSPSSKLVPIIVGVTVSTLVLLIIGIIIVIAGIIVCKALRNNYRLNKERDSEHNGNVPMSTFRHTEHTESHIEKDSFHDSTKSDIEASVKENEQENFVVNVIRDSPTQSRSVPITRRESVCRESPSPDDGQIETLDHQNSLDGQPSSKDKDKQHLETYKTYPLIRKMENRMGKMENRMDAMERNNQEQYGGLKAMDGKVDSKLKAMDGKVDSKLEAMDGKVDSKLEVMDGKVDSKLEAMDGKVDSKLEEMDGKLTSKLEAMEHKSSEQDKKLDSFIDHSHKNELSAHDSDPELTETSLDDQHPISAENGLNDQNNQEPNNLEQAL